MSRALFNGLTDRRGKKLLEAPHGEEFWTEHSGRAFVTSIAGAIPSVNQSWLKDVGRWAQDTSAGYIRTHLFRVGTIQQQFATLGPSVTTVASRLSEEDVYAERLDLSVQSG